MKLERNRSEYELTHLSYVPMNSGLLVEILCHDDAIDLEIRSATTCMSGDHTPYLLVKLSQVFH